MSFQPVIGAGGYAGWRLLSRTISVQQAIVARDPGVMRDTVRLHDRLAQVGSAEQLVADRRLLATTLSAFGLEADLGKTALIRKVLESDLSDRSSLANRLADKRYAQMARALGLGAGGAGTAVKGLADDIAARHVSAELERRVGTADGNLRIALHLRRELSSLAATSSTDATKWYTIIGSTPLRTAFTTAFGLGTAFGKLPVDTQLTQLRASAERMFGSDDVAQFSDPAKIEKLIQRFLLRAEAVTGQQSAYSAALTLLRG